MAITYPGAIAFSDGHIRPAADLLAQTYFGCKMLNQQWGAASGDNTSKFLVFGDLVRRVCDLMSTTYWQLSRSNQLWSALSMNSVFTNSAAELVYDSPDQTKQDPTRPPVTGQDVQRLQARMAEWLAWMEKNAFDPLSANTQDYTNLRSVLRLTSVGAKAPTTGWGVTVIGLTTALMTQYEATAPNNRTHILTVAVNVDPRL